MMFCQLPRRCRLCDLSSPLASMLALILARIQEAPPAAKQPRPDCRLRRLTPISWTRQREYFKTTVTANYWHATALTGIPSASVTAASARHSDLTAAGPSTPKHLVEMHLRWTPLTNTNTNTNTYTNTSTTAHVKCVTAIIMVFIAVQDSANISQCQTVEAFREVLEIPWKKRIHFPKMMLVTGN